MKNYNIGLDIGTSSVGWAVVETGTQKIIRKGNKRLWGVRLFDEAVPAAERRSFRSTRRRFNRRRERISLLQTVFADEINKIDSNFYTKLKESFFLEEDTQNKTVKLTDEEKRQIKEYNEKYPTIYHLRNELYNNTKKQDIRLVYLAMHHIIKYRGNFLYNTDSFNVEKLELNSKLEEIFTNLENVSNELKVDNIDYNNLETALKNLSKNDRKILINEELQNKISKEFINEFVKMMNGNKFNIVKMFGFNQDKFEISFNGTDYEDKYDEIENAMGNNIEIIDSFKQLYDMVFLKKLFKNSSHTNISALMVEKYNIHKKDLRFLKDILSYDRKIYNKFFRTTKNNKKTVKCLYDLYIHNHLSQSDFIKEIIKYLPEIFELQISDELRDKYTLEMLERLENEDFLPRITDADNGKYPYQLNKAELLKIIENQSKYYPFLLNKCDNTYKIVRLLEFRIPYYVGPLVDESKSPFAWVIKNGTERITPYNFEQMINKDATAEKFIKRMIGHCSYLLNEESIPSNSLLYSKFKVLNELKQIKINGQKIDNYVQHNIYNDLFLKKSGTITEKKFLEYLHISKDFEMYNNDFNITGYSADKKFANSMQTYVDFFGPEGIFENTNYNEEDAENIIEMITIFEDKNILKRKLESYTELSDKQVKKALLKKYKGWSGLSKKLLSELVYIDKETSTPKSIMDLMWETAENFMQIVNNKEYNFQELIAKENVVENKKISYELVENLATSPATKRGIYQALKVVDELVKYMGKNPTYVSIEMAREESDKKRTLDRKKYLTELYKNFKEQINNYNQLMSQLNHYEKIDSEKLFLYFIQEGKSLYSGLPLNVEDLNEYEVDHIIPRTLIKDDSIDNKALVLRNENQIKAASFVLPQEFRNQINMVWWNHLKSIGLMSAKKYYALTRTKYSEEDIEGFINRQLVETRQITKHVANIISNVYDKTKVIYLKANLSHNYRTRYELFKFRDINDYHHAHDAYLAAVLGEYKENVLPKKINFELIKELNHRLLTLKKYKQLSYGFAINSLDKDVFDILIKLAPKITNEKTGEILFDPSQFNQTVENNLYCNDILVSRKTEIRSGQFYKENILNKHFGIIEIHKGMNPKIYGGYSGVEPSYLALIKYKNKQKLIGIPKLYVSQGNQQIDKYISENLKLKKNETYKIVKDKIPFDTKIIYSGQPVYIKGFSLGRFNCEVSNARELKINKEYLIKWKYVLNKILNQKNIPKINKIAILTEEQILQQCQEILIHLLKCKSEYPLFQEEIKKIENVIDVNSLTYDEISKVIKQLFILYQCNSSNANLKDFGLSDRIGRLSGKTITEGTLINTSVSGIKERRNEF